MGYLFVVAFQYTGAVYIFTLGAGVILFGVGLFLLSVTGVKEMKMNLNSINERGVMAKNLSWTMSQIAEFIQNYSVLRQLSANDNSVLSPL